MVCATPDASTNSGLTLTLLSQRKKIHENLRAFFLYRRKDDLRSYLLLKRNEIECSKRRWSIGPS